MSPLTWVAASVVLLGCLGLIGWMAEKAEPAAKGVPRGSMAGVYRDTIQFAYVADAPIIVGTGRKDPLKFGAEIAHSLEGNTLHIRDWSKSPVSQVMPKTRLWPREIFALSPDEKQLVWANGTILDLARRMRAKIDELLFDLDGNLDQRRKHYDEGPILFAGS